jgi:hypothetical protein
MEIKGEIGARSCNHCCGGKSVICTYSEMVFISLVILHAMRLRHIVICGQLGCKVSDHISSQTTRLSKKVIERKMCVVIFSTIFF